MYFLSLPDPDISIKSSRDPLGFQAIWQTLGRNVVAHLSTVSSSLVDFRVMALAYYFYEDREPKGFIDFFIRWEQVCAYAREDNDKDSSYNGKNFVSKKVREGKTSFNISNRPEDTILSNQKSYGIYGKYNRPFGEIGLHTTEEFSTVFEEKVNNSEEPKKINKIVKKLYKDSFTVNKDDLKCIYDLIKDSTKAELELYENTILKTKNSSNQNILYETLVEENFESNINSEKQDLDLYGFIEQLKNSNKGKAIFIKSLDEIYHAEKIIYICSMIFKHLQTRFSWTISEILQERIMKELPQLEVFEFSDEWLNGISTLINNKDKKELIISIVRQNQKIAKRRNNPPWIEINNDKISVVHRDGAQKFEKWDVENNSNNTYFLYSYLSLFYQIKNAH